MGIEKKIVVNTLTKRPDIVVFDKNKNVQLIVECKAPEVKLTEDVINQIIVYNMALKSRYLLITNGRNFFMLDCTSMPPKEISLNEWKYTV